MWERGVSSGGKPVLRSEETLRNRSHELLSVTSPRRGRGPGCSHRRSRLSLCDRQLFFGVQLPATVGRKGERLFDACLSLSGSGAPKSLPQAPVPSSLVFPCPTGPAMRTWASAFPGVLQGWAGWSGGGPPLGEQEVPRTPLTQCSHSWALGVHGCWGAALCQRGTAPWGGRWGDPGGGHCLSRGATRRR